jgi:hypothetical protein
VKICDHDAKSFIKGGSKAAFCRDIFTATVGISCPSKYPNAKACNSLTVIRGLPPEHLFIFLGHPSSGPFLVFPKRGCACHDELPCCGTIRSGLCASSWLVIFFGGMGDQHRDTCGQSLIRELPLFDEEKEGKVRARFLDQ